MSLHFRRRFWAWVLFLPQACVISLLIIGVMVGMVQSFGIIPSLGFNDFTFDFYRQALSNPQLKDSIIFSLKIALASSLFAIGLGLGISYVWLHQIKPSKFSEIMIRIPIIVPHIVVSLFVLQFLSRTGLLARLLFALGIENARDWFEPLLYQPNGIGVILGFLWKEVPFVVFYCFPMIQSISDSIGQAARTLGASRWQTYWKIILPLAKKTIFAAFFIIFMFTFGTYELPALLGPTVPRALPVMTYQAYTHPDLSHRPYAMAMNGLILFVGLAAILCIWILISLPQIKHYRMIFRKGGGDYEG